MPNWSNIKIKNAEKVRDNTISDTIDYKKIKCLVMLENLVNLLGEGNWKMYCFKYNLESEFVSQFSDYIESGELKSTVTETAEKYNVHEIELLKKFLENIETKSHGEIIVKIERNY